MKEAFMSTVKIINNSFFLILAIVAVSFSPKGLATDSDFKKTSTDPRFAATNKSNVIPKVMMFQGKPIDALCFGALIGMNGKENPKVDLSQCSKEIKQYKIEEPDQDLIKEGFTGINYSSKDPDSPWGGYAYYKYLGKHDNDDIIYFLQNTGGSGTFSHIILLKREGDALKLVENLVSGDRCNDGIAKAKFENNQIFYTINITPFDYIPISKENIKIEPYDDLANCAACCQGTADFVYDFKNHNLVKIDLGELSDETAQTQGQYQACFNGLIGEKIKNGQQQITEPELKLLVKDFKERCMK